MCREASDTSDAWQDLASPENILALIEIAVPVLEQKERIKHVGYLFVNGEGSVVYSPSGFGIPGFTCAGKIYGDVNIQHQPSTNPQIDNDGGKKCCHKND